MFNKLITLFLLLPLLSKAQPSIKEVHVMEYWKILQGTDDSLYGYYGSSTPICLTRSLGKLIKKASGGFNRIRAVTTDGNFYSSRQYNEWPTPMSWLQVPTDTTGAAFNDNTYVSAFEDVYFTIRSDGSIWYGGDDYFRFFYPAGTGQMRPTRISPAGVVFTKVSIGLRVLAKASNGDVYQWSAGNRTAVKINLPGPALDIATSWYDAQFAIVQKTPGSLYGVPYCWGGAWGSFGSPAPLYLAVPTNLAAQWGVTSLIKEISVDRQAVHYIDSLNRMWCPASYNVQGEGGFGYEWVNRYTYITYPGCGWSYADWQNPTTWPAVQVGAGVQWDHLYSTNWHGFYKNALSKDGRLYGLGRNKTNVLWMGEIYSPDDNGKYPNDFDVTMWKEETTPFTKVVKQYSHQGPVRGAGGNRTISTPNTVLDFTGHMTLAINGTDTAKGRVVAYKWQKLSGPNGDTSSIACVACKSTAVTGMTNGAYVYQVTTTDNMNSLDTSQVAITVALPKPKARIWVDSTTIHWPNTVFILADSSLNNTSTQWILKAGPNNGIWTSAGAADRRMWFSGLIPGTYTVILFVNGNYNQTDSATVTLTVIGPPACPICPVCPPRRNAIGFTIDVLTGFYKFTYDDGNP